MSPTSPAPVASTDSFSGASRDEVRRRYLAACEACRGSAFRPDLESFLASIAEPERSELRAELIAATTDQVGRSAETVDQGPPLTSPAAAQAADLGTVEDLRRFLAGEPIQARPVSRPERLWRWCRRNPRVAILTGTVALLVVVWAVTSSVLALSLKAQKDQTELARSEADRNAQNAAKQAGIAKDNEKEAKRRALIAKTNEDSAKHEARIALENETRAKETADGAVKQMVDLGGKLHNRLQSKRLAVQGDPDVRRIRAELLTMLKQSLANVSKKIEAAGTTTLGSLFTTVELGDLFARLGQSKDALKAYQQAHDLADQIAKVEPDNDRARANLSITLQRLGDIAIDLDGDALAARNRYKQALALNQEILDKPRSKDLPKTKQVPPVEIKRILSNDNIHLGKALTAIGDPAAARKHFEQALAYRQEWADNEPKSAEAQSYVVEARMWLGSAASHLDDRKAIALHFDEALRIAKSLSAQNPKHVSFKQELAEVQGAHADALLRLGKTADAAQSSQDSLRNLQVVIASNPDDLSQTPLLALTHERLALASVRLSQWTDADKHFKEALQLRAELRDVEPANLSRQAAYLLALARCGKFDQAAQAATKLRPSVARSTELLLQLARCHARCAVHDPVQEQTHIEAALDVLRAATGGEFRAAAVLVTDPDLEPVRAEPTFKKLVAQIQARSAPGS